MVPTIASGRTAPTSRSIWLQSASGGRAGSRKQNDAGDDDGEADQQPGVGRPAVQRDVALPEPQILQIDDVIGHHAQEDQEQPQ
jgi:hypothetical protein